MKNDSAPSVANAHEKGQMQGVAAVAGGSLWVPAGKLLELSMRWKNLAVDKKQTVTKLNSRAPYTAHTLYDQAHALEDCARELESLAAYASKRQPTENKHNNP